LTAPRKRFEKREAGKEKQRPLLGKNKNSRSATQALTLLIAVRQSPGALAGTMKCCTPTIQTQCRQAMVAAGHAGAAAF
jgi:hypothetical protein